MEYDPASSQLALGDKAPYFSLPSTDGKIYSISDFADCKAFVVVFTSNHCPYARAYEERLCALSREFSSKEIGIVAICSNDGDLFPEDSFEQMVEKSKKHNFAYPYLQDKQQSVARAYSAQRTPEAYLFDAEMKLAYHGAIDDNHADAENVSNHWLAEAAERLLQGETPNPQLSPIIGCSIKFS